MNANKKFNGPVSRLLLVGVVCLLTARSVAQENPNVDTTEPENIERLEVKGKKPLTFYIKDMEKKQKIVIASINESISIPDMKIKCKRVQIARSNGSLSKMKRNECRPVFESKIEQQAFDDAFRTTGNINIANDARNQTRKKIVEQRKELAKIIKQLYSDNSDFRTHYIAFKEAEDAYKNAHSERFGVLSEYSKTEK